MNSRIAGKTVHILGSASGAPENATALRASHAFVRALARRIFAADAKVIVLLSGEPTTSDDLPQIFDWTIVEEFVQMCRNTPPNAIKPRIVLVFSSSIEAKLTKKRQDLWKSVNLIETVISHPIESSVYTGGEIRNMVLDFADAFVAISGGKGVVSTHGLALKMKKPFIPLPIDIGCTSDDGPGSISLYGNLLTDPGSFLVSNYEVTKNKLTSWSIEKEPKESAALVFEVLEEQIEAASKKTMGLVMKGGGAKGLALAGAIRGVLPKRCGN